MHVASCLRVKWFNDCVGLLFRFAEEYHSIHLAWLSVCFEALSSGWLVETEQFQLLLAQQWIPGKGFGCFVGCR